MTVECDGGEFDDYAPSLKALELAFRLGGMNVELACRMGGAGRTVDAFIHGHIHRSISIEGDSPCAALHDVARLLPFD